MLVMRSYFNTYINMIKMDIKYPIENKYMKCALKINRFSGPRPRVWSSRQVRSSEGEGGGGVGGGGMTRW